jgi:enoyl-CoA hydratase/carnithine racemase
MAGLKERFRAEMMGRFGMQDAEMRFAAQRIAANPSHAVRLAKRLQREAMYTRLDTHLEMAAGFQALSHQTEDHREAVNAFLEKRPPVFRTLDNG